MFKALGDPVRLRLLSLIASHPGGEACVCGTSPTFDVSQPTISHHLKDLRSAGPPGLRAAGHLGVLLGGSLGAAAAFVGPACRRPIRAGHSRCGAVTNTPTPVPTPEEVANPALHAGPVLAGVDRRGDGRRPTPGSLYRASVRP